jgi:sarcosine oxidase subunit alpha
VLVATGAYEAPLLFDGNDLPGVMLSTAVQRLIHLHGIKPAERAVIVGEEENARQIAADLKGAGVEVVAIARPDAVVAANGRGAVKSLETRDRLYRCDLVVVVGHRVPNAGLLHQAGGRLRWDQMSGAFRPCELPPGITAAGEVTGDTQRAASPLPPKPSSFSKSAVVCLCGDVTACDIAGAVDEGFDQIETVKRYTTTTMGPCQGRMCQLNAIAICASATGRDLEATGVTTSRPPSPSVSLGALAGPRLHPMRLTPMHYDHEELRAVWLDMGEWKRPRFYRTAESADESTCVRSEYQAVRERVGVIDVSTLGKLDVKGRDAAKLLDKVYTHRMSDLRPGRIRYGVICDEAGIMLDDGTVSRLDDTHFFITTTTGNLDFVDQWLRWWSAGTGWDVHITEVTAGFASINVAGPRARDTLRKLTSCPLETAAFPYMACRQATVADAPAYTLRIGFVGETGWELHVPAEFGSSVWRALLEAGEEFGIRPFGVEAQRLLRLEKRHVIVGVDSDALTGPYDAGMAWTVTLDKADFVGRTALRRAAEENPRDLLVGFVMQDDLVPDDGAAIVVDGKPAGRVTSARFSPGAKAGIGLAWVPRELSAEGTPLQVHVRGRMAKAIVRHAAFYDPEGKRLRA